MLFEPSVYEHAAALIGETPWRVSRDGALLVRSHAEAFRLYRHRPVVVGIDLYNLEAEAYGAVIAPPPGNAIPSIAAHPCAACADIAALPALNPRRDGRLPLVLAAGERLARICPEADVRIPISGPFSLACALAGFACMLADLLDNPAAVRRALDQLVRGQLAFAREALARNLGVSFFESAAAPPLVSPALFADLVQPPLATLLRETAGLAGGPVPCIIGGDTAPILEAILETGPGAIICPRETDQAAFLRRLEGHPEIPVRLNMDPGVFAAGDAAAVERELARALALAGDRPRLCIGSGVLPYDADPVLVLKVQETVRRRRPA